MARAEVLMVARRVLGALLVVGIPLAIPRHRRFAPPASPTLSRRPTADYGSSGEFVYAIDRGRAERRPLRIVQA